jgi:hypothetical protein
MDSIQNILSTYHNIEFIGGDFNKDDLKVSLKFVNNNDEFDVLKNDAWKSGHQFDIDLFKFEMKPFFQRLVCSNGMSLKEYGDGISINKKQYSPRHISYIIYKNLTQNNWEHETLITQVNKLNSNNVSLKEFYSAKKIIDSIGSRYTNDNMIAAHQQLVLDHFSEEKFLKAYNIRNIDGKSDKWLSTANSGINAYQFFNNITWFGTHRDKTNVTTSDSFRLNKEASELLFKKCLDLEDFAPTINI